MVTTSERLPDELTYSRYEYVNRLGEQMVRARHFFYDARIAQINGCRGSGYRRAWNILDVALTSELLHPTRGHWNRRDAFDQAVSETKLSDIATARWTEREFAQAHKRAMTRARLEANFHQLGHHPRTRAEASSGRSAAPRWSAASA